MVGRHRAPRRSRFGIAVSAMLLAAGVVGIFRAVVDVQLPPAAAQLIPASVGTAVPSMTQPVTAAALSRSTPVSIRIPSISVNAPVMRLGLNSDGTIQLPPLSNHNLAGWYGGSVTPGQRGTSVFLGHVDDYAGTSVFFYIKDLHKGDKVEIARANGSTAVFTVDGVQKVSKANYPASMIYKDEPYPALRLITCGGPFDRATGAYTMNIVVYAHLTGSIA